MMEGDEMDGTSSVFQDDLPEIQVMPRKKVFAITEVVDIGNTTKPNQPVGFKFPYRSYGIKIPLRRAFQPSWFSKWRWIHYDEKRDLAFCHVCVRAIRRHGEALMSNGCGECTFISTGYCNWKEASIQTRGFSQHENSLFHLKCTESLQGRFVLPKSKNVKSENQRYLKVVMENIRFLARQGMPLQGTADDDADCGSDGNFVQLMKLTENCEGFVSSTLRSMESYFNPTVQNELLGIMGLEVLHSIASEIRESKYFSIMIDEVTESSSKNQVVVCLRWVDGKFQVQEEFVGLYTVPDLNAQTLVKVVKDTLVHLNLDMRDCRGLSYDGPGNVKGRRNDTASQLQAAEPRAIYTHCYGHCLNLAIAESLKQNKVLCDFLNSVFAIEKLVKFLPCRLVVFHDQSDHVQPNGPGKRVLCPTRWFPEVELLKNVLESYAVLQALWEQTSVNDQDGRFRILAVKVAMQNFQFLFVLQLTEKIFRITDNLSRTLQHLDYCASAGHAATALTVTTLQKMRTDNAFLCSYSQAALLQQKEDMDVDGATTPRRCKTSGSDLQLAEDYYRCLYFEAIDRTICEIEDRFGQPGYQIYGMLESLLLKSVMGNNNEVELRSLLDFYKDDFDGPNLKLHLELLETAFDSHADKSTITLSQIETFLASLKVAQQCLFMEVCNLLKIALVIPATNAISDRSCTAMQRIKNYLRTTSIPARVNRLMLLHVHQNKCDTMCLWRCLNTFVDGHESRLCRFGKYKKHFCCLSNG